MRRQKFTNVQKNVLGIILAGGAGSRFGGPKQFYKPLKNQYLFEYTLRVAVQIFAKKNIILVLPSETSKDILSHCKKKYAGVRIVFGGANRLYSILNALSEIKKNTTDPNNTYVALIDASRPLLQKDVLLAMIQRAISERSNYILTREMTDFIARRVRGQIVPIDRSLYVTTHTPHVYQFNQIFTVLQRSSLKRECDSALLLHHYGIPIREYLVTLTDFKVTYSDDMKIVAKLLNSLFHAE